MAKCRYILVSLLSVIASRNVYLFIYRVLLFNMLSVKYNRVYHRTISRIPYLKMRTNTYNIAKLIFQNKTELQALGKSNKVRILK